MDTLKAVDILLPDVAQPEKWAVVSCDQFTSQRDYWEKLKQYVGDAPSALKLIFPEVYLDDGDERSRIENINANMESYLSGGVFRTLKDSFIFVKRDTRYGCSRLGLIVAVDLEDYSFVYPNNAAIRSTEGVVADRIPPRLKIRADAPIELPHIMLLIDDRKKSVIEPLYANRAKLEKLYDFDLNMNGGHLSGYRVDAAEALAAFDIYASEINGRYGSENNFLFAVGDGNHSLATAQAHWNKIKVGLNEEQAASHPARYALCEVENLHDDGINFEPIHRYVFGADDAEFVSFMSCELSGDGELNVFTDNLSYRIHVASNGAKAISDVQGAIEKFLKEYPECRVDYIHGLDNLNEIACSNTGVAVEMPKIKKEELFEYVLEHGNLSKKAFSMGEAEEKRYYMEAKKIK